MKQELLKKVEEIINTLACNEAQTIEVRGSFNAAINLRAMMEQISESDMKTAVVAETPKEEPTRWTLPESKEDKEDKKSKE